MTLVAYARGYVCMEALAILVVLPVVVGVAAARWFYDPRYATLAAVVGAALAVCTFVALLDREGQWAWIAALMVSPLTVAFAVATALICHGRSEAARRRRARER